MSKKTVVIIEFIVCVLAIIVISIFGLAPDTWRRDVPATKLEVVNVSDPAKDIEVTHTTKNGRDVVNIKLPRTVLEYKLLWKISPEDATNTQIRFTSSAINDKIISVSEEGVVKFLTNKFVGVSIVLQTTDGTNLRVDVSITFQVDEQGGDIEL